MISVQADNVSDGKALEKEVDEDLTKFNEWFIRGGQAQGNTNEPLTTGERAIIKTYLWYKTHGG